MNMKTGGSVDQQHGLAGILTRILVFGLRSASVTLRSGGVLRWAISIARKLSQNSVLIYRPSCPPALRSDVAFSSDLYHPLDKKILKREIIYGFCHLHCLNGDTFLFDYNRLCSKSRSPPT